MSTKFTVEIQRAGVPVELQQSEFTDLESAIRMWDRSTFNIPVGVLSGGIRVEQFITLREAKQGGLKPAGFGPGDSLDSLVKVRDGWILHIFDQRAVYLNPNLVLAN